MRHLVFIFILSTVSLYTNASDSKKVSIYDVMKVDVSESENIIRKIFYTNYTFKSDLKQKSWEQAFNDRLDKVNSKYKDVPVTVAFDTVASKLNDTVLDRYEELTKRAFPDKKKKLLENKIRSFLLRSYLQNYAKTYLEMKRAGADLSDCPDAENDDIEEGVFPMTVCTSTVTDEKVLYDLLVPTDKNMGRHSAYRLLFVKSQNKWILNEIILNPELLDENFFMYLAYIK